MQKEQKSQKTSPATKKLPFLEFLCWQMGDVYQLTPAEMLSRYERGWRYRDIWEPLDSAEQQWIKDLAIQYHSWLMTEL